MGAAVDDDDDNAQWTRIVRKGKKLSRCQERPPLAGPPESLRPNPSPQLSADDIQANHARLDSQWRSSKPYRQLSEFVKSNVPSHVGIQRAVCLGIGSFDPDDGSWNARRKAHVQLAAFMSMVELLVEREGQGEESQLPIECFFQEPRFAEPDKAFLANMGAKVVESPAGYDLVGSATLVFGIHLYRDIWAAALDKGPPGMFVGTGWDVWGDSPAAETNPDFDRIRDMDSSFDKFPFPQDEHNSFSSTCIYWKRHAS